MCCFMPISCGRYEIIYSHRRAVWSTNSSFQRHLPQQLRFDMTLAWSGLRCKGGWEDEVNMNEWNFQRHPFSLPSSPQQNTIFSVGNVLIPRQSSCILCYYPPFHLPACTRVFIRIAWPTEMNRCCVNWSTACTHTGAVNASGSDFSKHLLAVHFNYVVISGEHHLIMAKKSN